MNTNHKNDSLVRIIILRIENILKYQEQAAKTSKTCSTTIADKEYFSKTASIKRKK